MWVKMEAAARRVAVRWVAMEPAAWLVAKRELSATTTARRRSEFNSLI